MTIFLIDFLLKLPEVNWLRPEDEVEKLEILGRWKLLLILAACSFEVADTKKNGSAVEWFVVVVVVVVVHS